MKLPTYRQSFCEYSSLFKSSMLSFLSPRTSSIVSSGLLYDDLHSPLFQTIKQASSAKEIQQQADEEKYKTPISPRNWTSQWLAARTASVRSRCSPKPSREDSGHHLTQTSSTLVKKKSSMNHFDFHVTEKK